MPDELEEFYEKYYSATQYTGAMGVFHDYYHKKLERYHLTNKDLNILEVGAGFGEHIKFVQLDFDSYTISDLHLDEVHPHLLQNLEHVSLANDERIKLVRCDILNLPFQDSTFDRVVITCVLHHVSNLEFDLQEISRVVKNNGHISFYFIGNPGLLYRIIRHYASHKKQSKVMKTSMAHVKYIWSLEHLNHYPGILAKIRWIFKHDETSFNGVLSRFIPYDLSIFKVVEIKIKK